MPSTCPGDARKGKTRQRSRFGCRNCKLRKLKCDEGKPQCKRCTSFGVLCNFTSSIPDLQPALDTGRTPAVQGQPDLQPSLTNAIWASDASTSYQLNAKCQDLISRYLGRSLITPDDPNMIQVNHKLLELAFAYPYLMHASLAVALTYDRNLTDCTGDRRSLQECYHWSQSTVLLNKRLREPIRANDKDPIWGTAAALAVLTFSSPDAHTPEQAWPMKSSGSSDLDWLRMIRGKMSLYPMVNPLRPDSIFHIMAATFAHMLSPLPERGIDGISRALAAVCGLGGSSTAESGPYFLAAHAVSQILDLPDGKVTTGQTQLFTQSINGPFEELLRGRDPVALLLLYLWYRKSGRSTWWIELRARVECPSICLYLRTYHSAHVAVHAFLPGGALADTWA